MKFSPGRILLKVLKIIGIVIISFLLLMFIIPYVLPNTIQKEIKKLGNQSINGEINFSGVKLSFFKHFPSLTLTLTDFSLKGAAPFQNDTLLSAQELALGLDLKALLKNEITVNKFFFTDALINIQVNEKGEANYNVYKSRSGKSTAVSSSDSSSASLRIENINIEKGRLVYNDESAGLLIKGKGLNYSGECDLSKAIFDLGSHLKIDSFDFYYEKQPYVVQKRMDAKLITKINTNSLALVFEKNDLQINDLPVQVTGRFDFLENGYDMDFKLKSSEADLHDVFTALPPQYQSWLSKTKMKGKANIDATLVGNYIAGTDSMPDATFDLRVRDGYIAYEKAPLPLNNLFLNIRSGLPKLNTDSLVVNIDSVFFNIEKDYFSSVLRVKGYEQPYLFARVHSEMDLEKLDRALGLQDYDIKGKLALHFTADGQYAKGQNPDRLRKDIIITSIPAFDLRSSLQNGYFKFASLPQPISAISFRMQAFCADNNYKHTSIKLDDLNATMLSNFIKGHFYLDNADGFPVDAALQTVFHLSDVKQFYPLDSMDMTGDLNIDIQTKGNFLPAKKMFPVTKADFSLKNGTIQTSYYPKPIENIQVNAVAINAKGTLSDLSFEVQPVSFTFEGQPFMLKADLQNFDNLRYNITSKGVIDIGKIYKVFSSKGIDVKGFIRTSLAMKGAQADVMAGRYERLYNSGELELENIAFHSDAFPQPFFINKGLFRFKQDKMWFDQFKGSYGKTNFTLNGYLENIINYSLKENEKLRGNFDLNAPYLLVDEFAAFADSGSDSDPSSSSAATGVIIVPRNLDLVFKAAIKQADYNGLAVKNFKGQLMIDSGKIKLRETAFTIVDAPVNMDATYSNLTPEKGVFDFHFKADSLDVRKAYDEIKLFRDMVPAAGKAKGTVGLDYSVQGRLNEEMMPVYPSLKGGGVVSVKKVKLKGFRLMNAVSKATDKNEIRDPDLSRINIKSRIDNNIITIEKIKMKIAGFRPRFEGQVSFDGKLNLKGRIGLPPLGIIGIPFSVTGTQDNPKVKLRKGKATDQLEETEIDEEENPEE